jgi:hypothetical protein
MAKLKWMSLSQRKSNGTKRSEMDESDSEDEDNHEGEDTKQQMGDVKTESKGSSDEKKEEEEKKKRKNRKKKKRKGPNHWIYITDLPKDIIFGEVKNHFSKVRFISFACRVFCVRDGLVHR